MTSRPHLIALEAFLPFVEEMLDDFFEVHRVWQNSQPDRAIDALGDRAVGIRPAPRMAQLMVDNLRRHFAGKPLLTPVS